MTTTLDNFITNFNGTEIALKCKKFHAFDALSFICRIIKLLPEINNPNADARALVYSRRGAEYLIMNVMETGKQVKITEEWKQSYVILVNEQDYFGSIFNIVFIQANKNEQTNLADELLSLFTYNGEAITSDLIPQFFPTPQILLSALLHAMRVNYNSFFILGGG